MESEYNESKTKHMFFLFIFFALCSPEMLQFKLLIWYDFEILSQFRRIFFHIKSECFDASFILQKIMVWLKDGI